jgi:hypothetical protein
VAARNFPINHLGDVNAGLADQVAAQFQHHLRLGQPA